MRGWGQQVGQERGSVSSKFYVVRPNVVATKAHSGKAVFYFYGTTKFHNISGSIRSYYVFPARIIGPFED